MAQLFPSHENIKRLKVPPTEGEKFLLKHLEETLADDVEIYFKPFLNGDIPDIVLMQKGLGVAIIEVNEWSLEDYEVDSLNRWYFKANQEQIKSPFGQVRNYSNNMYSLHINGLLEAKVKNRNFHANVKSYVYFHNITKKELETFYTPTYDFFKDAESEINRQFKLEAFNHQDYTKKLDEIKRSKGKLTNDLSFTAFCNDNIKKNLLPTMPNGLFIDSIYVEFHRYLQPPLHTIDQGKHIVYTSQQSSCIKSLVGFQKIRGVPGSGKTAVLAKRAVNAFKRHNSRVLILTYNITLVSLIRNLIDDIQEEFRFTDFYILTYHEFYKQRANQVNLNITISPETKKKHNLHTNEAISKYLDNTYYSNLNFFKNQADEFTKYHSIFIDEVQDYAANWLKIVKNYFLAPEGEMVLFGDEKQDIYHMKRESNDKNTPTLSGFGSWIYLAKSIRQLKYGDRIVNLAQEFQHTFFKSNDLFENNTSQLKLERGLFHVAHYEESDDETLKAIVETILEECRKNHISPNDIAILSSRIAVLRRVDYYIRKLFNEKTITTFEAEEMHEKMREEFINETDNIRKIKKLSFNLNPGLMKISTIHSYKGYESQSVFLIVNTSKRGGLSFGPPDNDEIIYTAITRTKENLMVFIQKESKYNNFFEKMLNPYNQKLKNEQKLLALEKSIQDRLVIDIQYNQHDNPVQKTEIKPYKILYLNENYYLACETTDQYKFSMFRLDMITDVSLTNTTFDVNIDIDDFVSNIQTPFTHYQENYRDFLIDVKLEIHKSKTRFFTSKKFLPSQKIVETTESGNLIISFKVTQESEVEDLIKKWLPYIKVLEPISLDEKIKNDIKSYLS